MASLGQSMQALWDASPSSEAGQSGKLETVGGLQAGLPTAGQPCVGLRSLDFCGIVEGEFCGSPIGRGKKMCVKPYCDVASHASKPKISTQDFGGSDTQVLIEARAGAGKDEPTAVFLTPSLHGDVFGIRLGEYLREKRTVDQWTSLFALLQATPNPTEEEATILAQRYKRTPHKTKGRISH
jgi:hypothetical protein